jgi:hypothetical protein
MSATEHCLLETPLRATAHRDPKPNIALTRDFATWHAIEHLEQLKTLDWLDGGVG